MVRSFLRIAVAVFVLLPMTGSAEPIKLKLSFFTSDLSATYQAAVKPFVEAVNRDGKGFLEIEVFLSGKLGKVQKELPQLVRSGGADIAFIVPGYNPEQFRDNAAIELPGLFHDTREATMVHTRLTVADALAGYEDFFVIGAYGTAPETIHSSKKLASLADLKGQRIRTNNLIESMGLEKLGALPTVIPINETTSALSRGMIDGAAIPVSQLFDIGLGRIATNHFLLFTSTAPLTLMMNRKAFDGLPEDAKTLIRKYSGEWTAARYIGTIEKIDNDVLERIKADPRRSIVVPSAMDLKTAQAAFLSIRNAWAATSPHNRSLLAQVDAEIAKLRAAQ